MRYRDFIITVAPKTIFESCRSLKMIELVKSDKDSDGCHIRIAVDRECKDLPTDKKHSRRHSPGFVLRGPHKKRKERKKK